LTLEISAEIRAGWSYATDIVAKAFRQNRAVGSHDRRRVAETVYALIRWDRRLDALLAEMTAGAIGAGEALSAMVRDNLKLLILEVREGVIDAEVAAAEARRLSGKALSFAGVAGDEGGLGDRQGLEREAVRLSFPTWLLSRFVDDWGEAEGLALAAAMNQRAPLAVRANGLKAGPDDLIARFAQEGLAARRGTLSEDAVILESRVNVFGLDAFREGLFEVMDEGSQVAASLVAPPPGGRVLDACAGAGGKTLALAAALAGKGRLLALDVDGKKLEELRKRARRAGLNNVAARALENDGVKLPAEAKPGAWDRVLVDAPCSGLGTLRRNPEARWRLTAKEVDSFPARQLALLVTYAPLVAVGGRLIYVTCTVTRRENDEVVTRFLAEAKGFVPMPVKEIWGRARADALGVDETGWLRLAPHRHDTDGFFAAVLRRVA
jgi:16S rRNA (cytosine967-C5)-methyltransferase